MQQIGNMKEMILRVVSALGLFNAALLLTIGEYYEYVGVLFIIGLFAFLELVDSKLKKKIKLKG